MSAYFRHAIVRRPGPNLGQGLTTSTAGPPDAELAGAQHQRYVATLGGLGLELIELEPLIPFPDSHFVEDVAIVEQDFAILARPGAPERLGEEEEMALVLETRWPLARIEAPGTVDGGDVLRVGDRYLIGVSDRTNEEGAAQLAALLAERGRSATALAVGSGLHLKSSVNWLGADTLIVTADYAGRPELADWRKVVVAPGEEEAANSLWVNGTVLVPAGFPGTRRRLEATGLPAIELDVSEARKMDGGLSCMSIRF